MKKKNLWNNIVFKTIFTLVVLLVVYTLIVCIIGYRDVSLALMNQYEDHAFRTAGVAARFVNPDKIDEYMESGGEGEEYETVWTRLSSICNSSGSTFIYVILPDRSDYKHITFLFSTMNQSRNYTQYEFGYVRETTNEEYEQKYRRICVEKSARELVIRDKGYIETDPHITAMIPLISSDGECKAILCVQYQMDEIVGVRNSYVRKVCLTMVITSLIIIIALSLRLNHSLLKPVRVITAEATRFASENVQAGQKLRSTIRNEDDIGYLAEAIDQMEEQIHDYVSNLTRVTAEKERISTEMSLASRIQKDMLPNIFPAFPDRDDFDIFATMDPAREIGGDFYYFFLIDNTHLCVVIADVSGKGVPAALFMMAATIVLVDNARMGKTPSQVLRSANEAICSTNREEMFVTVWLGILDLETGRLTASNAGHEYPVMKHPGGGFELIRDPHGFVVGGMEDIEYNDYELIMEPGSKLFVYTDGVPEAATRDDRLFGTDRMLEAMNADPDADPVTLLQNVKAAVNDFVADAEQFDDMTMLCLEYKGKTKAGVKKLSETDTKPDCSN